jgi:hypothetical protein
MLKIMIMSPLWLLNTIYPLFWSSGYGSYWGEGQERQEGQDSLTENHL